MAGQRPGPVAPARPFVEGFTDPPLHGGQPVSQGRVGVVVRVPCVPVQRRHDVFFLGLGRLARGPAVAAFHASMSWPAQGS